MVFGIVAINCAGGRGGDEVADSVVRVADDLILGVHGDAEAHLRATSMRRGDSGDAEEIAPGIVAMRFNMKIG